MSFDPAQIEALSQVAPGLPRGIVAERHYREGDWSQLSPAQRWNLCTLAHAFRTRPHFIAYRVGDLPALPPLIARHIFGLRLLAWTVRSESEAERAMRWADQMIFEGLRP
jgi:glycerophosphoryl diester phosphodiesterase